MTHAEKRETEGYDQRVIDIAKAASLAVAKKCRAYNVLTQMIIADIVFAINDALDAGILALPPATSEIGADMVLVPRVPTEAMLLAFARVWLGKRAVNVSGDWITRGRQSWSAMLAAAPSASAEGSVLDTVGWAEWADEATTPVDDAGEA